MATVQPKLIEAEAVFPVVGCQYPEHLEAVSLLIAATDEELEEELGLEKQTAKVQGRDVLGNAVVYSWAPNDAPIRVGWVPVAYEHDVADWFKFLDKLADNEHFQMKTSIENVKWLDEENGVLKGFDLVIKTVGTFK